MDRIKFAGLLVITLVSQLQFPRAFAAESESITDFLRAFHANPSAKMQTLPSFVDKLGNAYPRGNIKSNDPDWDMRIKFRDDIRRDIIFTPELNGELHALGIRMESDVASPPPVSYDSAARLVEPGNLVTNIVTMQMSNLATASIPVTPWADSYWPIYEGIGSNRYADGSNPESKDWQENYSYSQSNSTAAVIASHNAVAIDNLSPAEKYDYVMGDYNFTLSHYDWSKGQVYMQQYGAVPTWMGICHGWSGAAHMGAPYSKTPVIVQAPDGTPVRFYPQDTKALQSMLWAFVPPAARFAGTRCTISNPATNVNGRIIDPSCFDVSPSTWHEAVVNQLGIHQRSFVMDATYDEEVWNFPIVSYRYRYFNPQTWQGGSSVAVASIPLSEFTVDKFKEFRSPDAVNVVGVYMDVTYVIEMSPNHGPSDSTPEKTMRLVYDLELDANNNIVGTGEWYQNAHPDFLWTFNQQTQAMSPEDNSILNDTWMPGNPVPSSWTSHAQGASSRGAPLFSFVRHLTLP